MSRGSAAGEGPPARRSGGSVVFADDRDGAGVTMGGEEVAGNAGQKATV